MPEDADLNAGLHRHTEEIKEEYPGPLCWLLVELSEYNRDEWLGRDNPKSSTFGAEQVRDTGFTSNQQEWVEEIAGQMESAVDAGELRAFIKCQRSPWISRSEDEYYYRKKFAAELEGLIDDA